MMSGITYAAPGELDTTFNPPNGFVTYDSGDDNWGDAVAIQSDGKIVVVGGSHNGTDYDILVLRYNTDGSLDSDFGINGVATYDSANWDYGLAVAIQSDGKIVVAGRITVIGTGDDILVLRYNVDGSLDSGFGTNGVVIYDIGYSNLGDAVAIQSDGKIVVSGSSYDGPDRDVLVLRYNTDGSLDSGFGTNGVATYDSGNWDYGGLAVAIQSDGKIVVANRRNYSGIVNTDVQVLRYNTDGSLDNSFGTNGVATYDSGSNDLVWGVALQSDGKIVVAGESSVNWDTGYEDVLVLRYNPDGSLDNGFGTNGVVTYGFDQGARDKSYAVAIQPNGKIVVVGFSNPMVVGDSVTYLGSDVLVLRYNTVGSLDNSFGTNGVVTYGYDQGSWDCGYAVAIQPDGGIVIVGETDINGAMPYDLLVLRLLGDGTVSTPLSRDGSDCFIATAAYGSPLCNEVNVFRKFRDKCLLPNELGKVFVAAYYRYSPPLADWIAKHPAMRRIVRIGLYPVLEMGKWFVGENPSE